MSDKLETPQIMENVTDDIFGMCSICNKAKWYHTNDEKVPVIRKLRLKA